MQTSTPKPPGNRLDAHSDQQPTAEDTTLLLKAGIWFLLTGIAAVLLVETVFGGIRRHGPHTNTGWALLVLAMTCLPLGTLFSLLGGAKWLRNRRR